MNAKFLSRTIRDAKHLLANAPPDEHFVACVRVVRALGEHAIPLMPPMDWGGAMACINAQDGTGPLWEYPTMQEFTLKKGNEP